MPFFPFFSFFLFPFRSGDFLLVRGISTRVYSNSEAYELLMSGDVIVACGRFNCLAGLCGRATKGNSLLGLLCALPVVDCYFCARLFVYCGSVFFSLSLFLDLVIE